MPIGGAISSREENVSWIHYGNTGYIILDAGDVAPRNGDARARPPCTCTAALPAVLLTHAVVQGDWARIEGGAAHPQAVPLFTLGLDHGMGPVLHRPSLGYVITSCYFFPRDACAPDFLGASLQACTGRAARYGCRVRDASAFDELSAHDDVTDTSWFQASR